MLDIKFIRENKKEVKKAVLDKGLEVNIEYLLDLDKKRRTLKQEVDQLRQKRNEIAKKIKLVENKEDLIKNGREVRKLLSKIEEKYKRVKIEYKKLMHMVPQIPSDDTPRDKEFVVVEKTGRKRKFDFKPLDHIEIGKKLDILDLERGSKVGGYRGYYLKNEGTMLALGLMMYALDKMRSHGYTLIIPPTLVKEFTLRGSGYFAGASYDSKVDNIFKVASSKKEANGRVTKDSMFLSGTAEPSLLAYYSGEILDKEKLPLKLCGFSKCYRSEIGSYGKDTRGIYRVHEFMKVEQIIIAKADKQKSDEYQQEMLDITKEMYEELGLSYRLLLMGTKEQSAGKYKYYDLEVWTPGLKRWAETASASNFLDWQARRLNVKYKDKEGSNKYVYMLNNTALPTPRLIISILENYQQKDGSVKLPSSLQKWTSIEVIEPKKT